MSAFTPSQPADHRELASVARRGGRIITEKIARLLEQDARGAYWVDMRASLGGDHRDKQGEPISAAYIELWGGDPLRHLWETHLGTRKSIAAAAAIPTGYDLPGYLKRSVSIAEAESMMSWPIMARGLSIEAEEYARIRQGGDR